MKIVYDHQIFSLQNFGGISRYFYELSKNINKKLKKSDYAKIIAPFYLNNYINNKENLIKGIKVPVQNNFGKVLFYTNKIISPLLVANIKPDIIHQTYYFNQSSFLDKNCKKIITVHDMIHEIYPNYFPNSRYYIEAKKNAVNKADHVICISENTRRDLIRILGIDYDKTSVIHHGFLYSKSSNNKKLSKYEKPYILFVGSRGGYKNFRSLLSVFASKPDLKENYKLVAFGGGPFSHYEISLIRELGLNNNNIMQKSGDDNLLRNFYKGASLFVYPSLYEGFGLPPLEAMSCGCPVICSNSSAIPEVVGNAAIYFDPKSLSSIYSALETILNNKTKRNELIFKGFERIKNFEWSKCAEITFETYRKVIN
tara:strand:+ start:3764 stop:4870 length:1107 start_codon:yes stop_codon:yes gene_type:complete